jgi:hypothetical protein
MWPRFDLTTVGFYAGFVAIYLLYARNWRQMQKEKQDHHRPSGH